MAEDKKRILVVEDIRETAEMFVEMLSVSGYDVHSCANGQQAMEVIAAEMPDALILDMMMPLVSGLEVLKYLRGLPEGKETPVIVVSAKGMPGDVKEGMEAGATAYLTKPVSYSDLKREIEKALEED